MKLIPQNNNVVCKCISSDEKTTESGLVYKSNDVPLYEVVSIASKAKDSISLEVGDIVRVDSTGTKVEVDGVEYYMFNIENIVGKVI